MTWGDGWEGWCSHSSFGTLKKEGEGNRKTDPGEEVPTGKRGNGPIKEEAEKDRVPRLERQKACQGGYREL